MLIKKNPISSNYLLNKQLDILFNASLSGGLLNIFAVWLIYVLVYESQHQANALILGITVTTLTLIRTIFTSGYIKKKKNHKAEEMNLGLYITVYTALTLTVGCAWGIFEFSQLYHNDEEVRNMIFLINFGLIAGGVAILSVWLPAYLVYILPQAIAIFTVFVSIDDGNRYYIAFTFLIFVAVMISTSFNVNRSRKKEIELSLNNEQLINDLNKEIHIREGVQLELEDNKADLENKVKDRTKKLINTNMHLKSVLREKEKAEESLQYLAYHDELTGLPNRNLLIDRINQSLKISTRDNQQMAILFLDLDRFKTINDSLGHIIGDELLQNVAARLHRTLRKHDTVSRNGGDEFVIVLEKLKTYNQAVYVAKKVIDSLTRPFEIHSHKIHIGASIGISVYPVDGETPLILLRNADTAMYRAKQLGGNQLQFYDPSMSNQLRDRLELESELHSALDNNEFYLVYQPQVSIHDGVTVGVESLMRWKNKKHGEVSPVRFIPLLEETGLIYTVGKWVVSEAIRFIQSQTNNNITCSVNLSALQCNNYEFIDYVKSEIKQANIDPARIEFEVTESLLISDFEKTKIFLGKLHSLGCTVALDDFGTGYTSMSYLARLPIDVIKIDKSLIRDISEHNNLKSIVNAIVTMSNSLGVKNIFEGVETTDELNAIKKLNGGIIQGYLYSKPLAENEIIEWLTNEEVKTGTNISRMFNAK
jgi:diguanylate cyclase (GGDEF)-like protein